MVPVALGAAVALLGLAALLVSGSIDAQRAAFVEMGFDDPRAALLAALLAGAAASTLATLVSGSRRLGVLTGVLGAVAFFAKPFYEEVRTDVLHPPTAAHVEPMGVVAAVFTITVAGIVTGWAAAVLASAVRTWLQATGRTLAAARSRSNARPAALGRSVFGVAVLAALLVAGPIFADMVNIDPDADLLVGGSQQLGLLGSGAGAVPSDTPRSDVGGLLPSAPPGQQPPPWLAWRPSGAGRVTTFTMPAPWRGGSSTQIHVQVYIPPGYGAGRRYPVVYVPPWSDMSWRPMLSEMDALVDQGVLPGELFVFASETGSPYTDTECIDSPDGREWYETFLTSTLIHFVDAHFATIAQPTGRVVASDSKGGYCAADLLVRHPDLYRSAISWSGYYVAAPPSNQTLSAAAVFDGNSVAMNAHNPTLIVPTLPDAVRAEIFQVLVANPSQAFYGPQMTAYAQALKAAGILVDPIASQFGHSWTEVRATWAQALLAVAERMVALRVFG